MEILTASTTTDPQVTGPCGADHAEALAMNDERDVFTQNRAWCVRRNLLSGRREHVQAAIEADHAEALSMNILHVTTGPCEMQASPFCTGTGIIRLDPMSMTGCTAPFTAYAPCCQDCYDVRADMFVSQVHGR